MDESNPYSRPGILPVLTTCLVAVAFLTLSNGRYPISVCTWLGPLFIIHFSRGGRSFVRLPLACLRLSCAFGYQFDGMLFGGPTCRVYSGVFGVTLVR
jgi:hypothetical protein